MRAELRVGAAGSAPRAVPALGSRGRQSSTAPRGRRPRALLCAGLRGAERAGGGRGEGRRTAARSLGWTPPGDPRSGGAARCAWAGWWGAGVGFSLKVLRPQLRTSPPSMYLLPNLLPCRHFVSVWSSETPLSAHRLRRNTSLLLSPRDGLGVFPD